MSALSQPLEPDLRALREVFNRQRADSGMTFDELAEVTGLSRRTLLNISSGESSGDLRSWLILSRTWGVSLDDTFESVWR